MKIKFKKLEATPTFIKLFGIHREKSGDESVAHEDKDSSYEYYYKRGHTYYFRNSDGNKLTIDYKDAPKELIRGNTYKLDAINRDSSE